MNNSEVKSLNCLSFFLSAHQIRRFLLTLIFSLNIISFLLSILHRASPDSILITILFKLFSVDTERSIPTFYSTATLLLASVLVALISYIKQNRSESYVFHWFGLSLILAFLGWDEAVQIHEKFIDTPIIYRLLDSLGLERSGVFTFPWVLVATFGVFLFLVLYSKFLFDLPKILKKTFLTAIVIYVGGALGMEMLGGLILGDPSQVANASNNFVYILNTSLEEMFEMVGVLTLIYGLLIYLNSRVQIITINLSKQ